MKKLLPVVISGVMAISFSQLAAAQAVGVQGPAGTGANVDLNNKGGPAADVQNSQQLGGQNQSQQQSGKGNKQSGASKSDKMEGDSSSSSAGASQSYEKEKDKDKDKDDYGRSSSGSSTGGATSVIK